MHFTITLLSTIVLSFMVAICGDVSLITPPFVVAAGFTLLAINSLLEGTEGQQVSAIFLIVIMVGFTLSLGATALITSVTPKDKNMLDQTFVLVFFGLLVVNPTVRVLVTRHRAT